MELGKKIRRFMKASFSQSSASIKSPPPYGSGNGKTPGPEDPLGNPPPYQASDKKIPDFGGLPKSLPPFYSVNDFCVETGMKEDELDMLTGYDTVVLVDDSGSMGSNNNRLWNMACNALSKLVVVASNYDSDGIDIYFLNDPIETRNKKFKEEEEVRAIFKKVRPDGATPLGGRLEEVTRPLMLAVEKGEDCKKTNCLIITDGCPTDDLEGTIVHIAKKLDEKTAPLSQLGIQFVQIGDNHNVEEFLRKLDDDLKGKHGIRDIVDTAPFNDGVVTAAELVKILLGGINRKIDRLNGKETSSS